MWGNKKAKLFIYKSLASVFVPTTGFEPAHLMAPPPQDGMSTNFTTWALYFLFQSHVYHPDRYRDHHVGIIFFISIPCLPSR